MEGCWERCLLHGFWCWELGLRSSGFYLWGWESGLLGWLVENRKRRCYSWPTFSCLIRSGWKRTSFLLLLEAFLSWYDSTSDIDSPLSPPSACTKPQYKTSLLLPLPMAYCKFISLRLISFSFTPATSTDHRSNLKDLRVLCNDDGDDCVLAAVFIVTWRDRIGEHFAFLFAWTWP